jgi:MFS family permease
MQSAWPRPAYAWYATLVLMLAYTLSYIDRQILSMLVGPIKSDLGVSDTQIGLLQGLAFAVFYTLIGIPLGRLADRGDRRRIIAWGVFLWSLATAASGLARSFGQLFAARVAVGVGEAALGPAAYSMIADQFPPGRRGRALGVYSMGIYLGIGLAAIIGGAVVGRMVGRPPVTVPLLGTLQSWHVAFLAVGLPGLLLSLWVRSLREPFRHGAGETPDAAPSLREVFGLVRAHARFFGAHFLGYSMLTLSFNAVAFWMPPYLQRVHGLGPGEFGTALGLVLGIGGAGGIMAGGVFADWLRAHRVADAEIWPGILSALAIWPLGIATCQAPGGRAALLLFAGFMFFSSFAFAAAAAALQAATPNRMRGQVSAAYLFCVNLAGIGLGSFLTGFVNDFVYADESRVGDSMAWIVGLAAPLAALLLWAARRPYSARLADAAG